MEQAKSFDQTIDSGCADALSAEAALYFSCKQFAKCHEVMKRLSGIKPNDSKVLMNKALVDYIHKHNYSRTEDYVGELQRIASLENVCLIDNANSTITSHDVSVDEQRSATSVPLPSHTSTISRSYVPQSSLAIILKYNYALVLFCQRQYIHSEKLLASCLGIVQDTVDETKSDKDTASQLSQSPTDLLLGSASSILMPMIDLTPSTDLTLCRRVLLLWLEVLLRLQQAERVFDLCSTWLLFLSSISLAKTVNSSENTNAEKQLCSGLRFLNMQTSHMLTGIRKPLQLFYVRACLLTGRLQAAEDELKLLSLKEDEQKAQTDLPDQSEGRNASPEQSGATENTDKESHEASEQPDHPEGCRYTQVVWNTGVSLDFLKAQLAYLKCQYSTAIRQLADINSSSSETFGMGQCETTLVWNNLGLVHHRAGQYSLSGLQFRRALRETDKAVRDIIPQSRGGKSNGSHHHGKGNASGQYIFNQIPLYAFSMGHHHSLLYNFGLQLLFANKPSAAFSTLVQLIGTYPRNPRLWYRLAECCIKVHQPNNLSQWQLESRMRCLVEPIGVGPCRRLMLACGDQEISKPWVEAPSMSTPTLEFASLCLRNALLLLPKPPTAQPEGMTSANERKLNLLKWAESQNVPVLPALVPVSGLGLLHLMTAVHLAIAYVALCLNHPVDALPSAEQLLSDSFEMGSSLDSAVTENAADDTNLTSSNASQELAPISSKVANLGVITPPAYCFLARLYASEALTNMDRLKEAISLLKHGLPETLSEADTLDSMARCLQMVCFAPACLQPPTPECNSPQSPMNPDENVASSGDKDDVDGDAKKKMSKDRRPGELTSRPVDFPSTPSQAVSLLLYNLAAALSMDKQWNVAENYLKLCLPGLLLPVEQLDGKKWIPPPVQTNSFPASINKDVLPTSAILLQLYLFLALEKREQAAALLRQVFGHFALAGRLNSPSHDVVGAGGTIFATGTTDRQPQQQQQQNGWTANDLRQWLKAQNNASSYSRTPQTVQSTVQRPTSLWAPNQPFRQQQQQQQQQQQTTYVSPLLQTQIPQTHLQHHQQYAGRWEQQQHQQQTIQSPSQTTSGLITAANENDWPPL
ncbi:unnamed protein product [Calicophoron daubneyi]|uniref:CCR4-NOT transcription complex subunit 10 n=1 Tax=Calicophoron daubneyi TaxID=300641 RepID=A0AAV2SZT3_CALDB